MPPVASSGNKKRISPKQSQQNDVPTYRMPPINSFTSLGKEQLFIDGEDLEENPQAKGQTPVVKASNQQFEQPKPTPKGSKEQKKILLEESDQYN